MPTIISGGQTGADLAGLRAARDAGLPTGGWAPKGWLTEEGPQEVAMRAFGLQECTGPGYPARTRRNVYLTSEARGAVVIIGRKSPGSSLTERLARDQKLPVLWVSWTKGSGWLQSKAWYRGHDPFAPDRIVEWIREHDPERLMVAGNRESGNPGIERAAHGLLLDVFARLKP